MTYKERCIKLFLCILLFSGPFFMVLEASGNESEQTGEEDTEVVKVCLPPPDAPLTPALREHIAQWLDWQDFSESQIKEERSCGQQGRYNFCGGAYREEPLEGFSPQLSAKDDMRVQADEALLYAEGRSTLTGNVIVVQPNKQAMADTAYIYRDPKTKEITQIDLFGHVIFREPGRVMYGDEGHFLPEKKQGYIDNAIYRMSLAQPTQLESNELLQAWGRAASIERDKEQYHLKNATYTTCPPKDSSWQIKAKTLNLDKETGRGEAYHAFLNVHDWPVFYVPYYNFPIDDRRQSGFLMPTAGYSNNLGATISLPYYWNMAPNYDMLITPSYYSERGLNLGTDFRYLTEHSQGELEFNGIAHDRKFEEYVNDNQEEIGEDLSDNRYEVYVKDNTRFNENWSFNTQYHHVSDDYYMQDFGTTIAETTENQLLQQVDLDYRSEHWSSIAMMQHYQTLHPINQTAVGDVYSRYPQWILNGNYANLPSGLNFNINNEYDNFVWTHGEETQQPLGERYHINPVLARPIIDSSGYIKPTFQIQETYYGLTQNSLDPVTNTQLDQTMNVMVPQTSLDSSVFFDRSTNFLGRDWTQTLEPRLYYLYAPYVNQTEVPNFDSGYNIFTYDQLFRTNRFSGIDRVGDANQVSLAMMSRFLDADSGTEAFHWGIGQTYYFEDRQVQLMQLTDPDAVYEDNPDTTAGYMSPTDSYSPIASQIAYYLTPHWSLVGDGAWDPNTSETNNATVNLHYQPGVNQIINVGYSFLVNGDQVGITDAETQDANLNQMSLAYAWPFTPNHQWSSFGSWTQNISHNYPMNYSLGIQYEDCCWAIRLLGGKIYDSLDENNDPVYNNSIYLQILLKGVGNVANTSPAIIMNTVPGYQDIFK